MTYTINSEVGLMRNFEASSIEEAKAEYAKAYGFDFDNYEKFEGSWYWIEEDGAKVESHCENMPQ